MSTSLARSEGLRKSSATHGSLFFDNEAESDTTDNEMKHIKRLMYQSSGPNLGRVT